MGNGIILSSKDIKIEIKDAIGESVDISPYVQEISPHLHAEVITEEVTGYGHEWERHAATGLKRIPEITIRGWYETSDPDVVNILDKPGETITLIETIGTVARQADFIVRNFTPAAPVKELVKFECTLVPVGEFMMDLNSY